MNELFENRGKLEKRIPQTLRRKLHQLLKEGSKFGVKKVILFTIADDNTLRVEMELSFDEKVESGEVVIPYRVGCVDQIFMDKFSKFLKIPLVFGKILGFAVLVFSEDMEKGVQKELGTGRQLQVLLSDENLKKWFVKVLKDMMPQLSLLVWMFSKLMESMKVELQLRSFDGVKSYDLGENIQVLREFFMADFVAVLKGDEVLAEVGDVNLPHEVLLKEILQPVKSERLREGILNYSNYFNSQMMYESDEGLLYFVASRRSYAYAASDLLMLKLFAVQLDRINSLKGQIDKYYSYLQVVLDNLKDGVAVIDSSSRVVFANKQIKKVLKGSVLSIANPLWEFYERAISEKVLIEVQNFEWADRYYDLVIQPIRFEDEDAVVCVMRDKTFEVKMKGRLKRLEKLSVLGEFAVGIAHEIRNPLSGIKMLVQVLPNIKDSQEFDNTVKLINEEVERLAKIVDQINNFAKPAVVNKRYIGAEEVVLPIVEALKSKADKKGVRLEVDVKGEVLADADKLKQVVYNLVDNAIDACRQGGSIKIIGFKKDGRYELKVIDDGIGMNPEDMSKIFDPFFTKKEEGVGLGLSISTRIVDEHGGWIEVESEPGKGSTFTVILPGV